MKNPIVVFCPGCACAQMVPAAYLAQIQADTKDDPVGFVCAECFFRGEEFVRNALLHPKRLSRPE